MGLGSKWRYRIVAIAAGAVLASGLGLYLKLSWRPAPEPMPRSAPMAASAPAATAQNAAPADAAPSIDVAAERLAQRLKEKDGTGEDWGLLARSYVHLKRYPEAVDAFAKALEKMPGNRAFIDGQAAARKAAAEAAAR
jgi:cytochrome c-type biogenesis protein CcmH/NrfG